MLRYISLITVTLIICSLYEKCLAQANTDDIDWYYSAVKEDAKESFEKKIQKISVSLEDALANKDASALSRLYNERGFASLVYVQDYEKSIDAFVKALQIEDSLKLPKERFFTYLGIAQVFEAVGDYYKSAQFLKDALLQNEALNRTDFLVIVLNKLGQVEMALGHAAEALENYQLVLEYDNESGNPRATAEARFHIGNLYSQQREYTKALESHKLALNYWRLSRDRHNEARSLDDIGKLYGLMKNDDRSMANLTAALDVRRAIRDESGIASSYNTIGSLYLHQKNQARAIANLELALSAGREAQDQEEMRRSYEYLSAAYEATGDFKKALEYKDLFLAMNEFILNEKNERQLSETQYRYTLSQKETQITNLEEDRKQREKELAAQKKFQNVLLVVAFLAVAVAVLGLFLYQVKRKANRELTASNETIRNQNDELQQLNATKDKFFSIISHDLKGPLNSLSSFSGLLIHHTNSLSKEDIQMLARDLDKSLKNLFSLLENLLEWSRSQTGAIEFTPEAVDITKVLDENIALLEVQAQNKKITIVKNYAASLPVRAHKNSITTVVRNLLSNAIKFTPEGGTITVQAIAASSNLTISIIDTGVGMSKEVLDKLFRIDTKHSTKGTANEKGTGLGLILCKEFVEKNGGTIGVTSEEGKGSEFYFTLPL
jgi:signal transduction histidine kinase